VENKIEIPENIEGCVYKLWYAGKYVVVKCKTLVRSKENLETGLKYFFKNTEKGRNPKDLYFKFFSHALKSEESKFTIEIILQSNNPFKLLKAEHLALMRGKDDKDCLNQKFTPYIPSGTNKNRNTWINRGYYLNYMKWRMKFTSGRIE
jgi:hypothetical protein